MTTRTKTRIYALISALILLGGFVLILLPTKSQIPQSIGTSLVASGIVVLLDIYYRLIVEEDKATVEVLRESGIVAIHNRRDLDKYYDLVARVSRQLDITGYSLRAFYESFGPLLRQRLMTNSQLKARLLLVDPKSERSRAREKLEGHAVGTFAGMVDQIAREFHDLPNVEIRALDADLSTMIFRLDDTMFVGPQFLSRLSKATVTYEISEKNQSWLFQAYEIEFEEIWKASHVIKWTSAGTIES